MGWHTKATNNGLSGDVAFIKGSASEAYDLAIGRSYTDRGVRNDDHDAFYLRVYVPIYPAFHEVKPSAEASAQESGLTEPKMAKPKVAKPKMAKCIKKEEEAS